jgi:excisionase family DNA binding protein
LPLGGFICPTFFSIYSEGAFAHKSILLKEQVTMELFNRRETAAILGVSLTTLDKMRENKKIGYYQSCPGGKVQFTRKHIEQYWERIESSPREKYARKPKKAKLIF